MWTCWVERLLFAVHRKWLNRFERAAIACCKIGWIEESYYSKDHWENGIKRYRVPGLLSTIAEKCFVTFAWVG
jgi:hypothetical protein